MRKYRLPSGELTSDINQYLAAWHDLADPIVEKFGWSVISFDPGYQFSIDNSYTSISLPTSAVIAVSQALKAQDAEIASLRALAEVMQKIIKENK